MTAFRQLVESSNSTDFYVPRVNTELTTKRILTAELVKGKPLDMCVNEPQQVRDYIAARFFELCLKEIFIWRFMQVVYFN
jgi:aarF domain-containing kinase